MRDVLIYLFLCFCLLRYKCLAAYFHLNGPVSSHLISFVRALTIGIEIYLFAVSSDAIDFHKSKCAKIF